MMDVVGQIKESVIKGGRQKKGFAYAGCLLSV